MFEKTDTSWKYFCYLFGAFLRSDTELQLNYDLYHYIENIGNACRQLNNHRINWIQLKKGDLQKSG